MIPSFDRIMIVIFPSHRSSFSTLPSVCGLVWSGGRPGAGCCTVTELVSRVLFMVCCQGNDITGAVRFQQVYSRFSLFSMIIYVPKKKPIARTA